MKKQTLLSILIISTILTISGINLFAQTNYGTGYTTTQTIRNNSDVQYTVSNPDGVAATFTWIVTGGTIYISGVAQPSTYTQPGTAAANVSIFVRWDNTNKTSANAGTLSVSKTVGTCASTVQTFTVQSWVAPLARVSTASFSVCSGTASSASVDFEGNAGNSGYLYSWRVVRVSDMSVVEDHTASLIPSTTTTVTPSIAGITNTSGAPIQYRFELTLMQDGFTDIAAGDVSAANVTFTVNPVPAIGPINSSNSLILR
jgi:hypothetical protein